MKDTRLGNKRTTWKTVSNVSVPVDPMERSFITSTSSLSAAHTQQWRIQREAIGQLPSAEKYASLVQTET